MSITMLDHALAYAGKGYYVFPCKPHGKEPLTPNGHKSATTDENLIHEWWSKWLDANIGLALKLSGVMAIDLDRHPGKADGVEAYEKLRNGNKFAEKPPISISGGNGFHIILKRPTAKLKGKLAPGADILSNGYIILPPSIHPNGKPYVWRDNLSLLDYPPVESPQWLLDMIMKQEHHTESSSRVAIPNLYPISSGEVIVQRCTFMNHFMEDSVSLPEVDWYYGLGVLAYTVEAPEIVYQYSQSHPGYSKKRTEEKLSHWKRDGNGPPTCQTIQDKCGDDFCRYCPYNGQIKSPIVLGYSSHVIHKSSNRKSFPIEALPDTFRQFTTAMATALQCPIDYIGCSLLAAVSILMGSNWKIQLAPEWTQLASLWIALVGTPSSKKSPALEKSLCILRTIEQELLTAYKRDIALYEMQLEQYESDLKVWRKNPVGEIPIKPQKPILKRLTTSDTTIEALGELLVYNEAGISIACDELSSWFRSMNQYKGGRGADRSHYLSMWSNAHTPIDRKAKDPIILKRPYLCIVGCIQPDVLLEMSNQGTEDGMKERILFCCPLPNKEPPTSGVEVPIEIHAALEVCLRKIFNERPTVETCVYLSDGAQQVFLEARREWHSIRHSEGFQNERDAYYAKMENYMGRIALVLHEMRRSTNLILENEVTQETMRDAKALAEYFLNHAHIALGMVMQTREEQLVEKVVAWIQRRKLLVVNPRDLTTNKVAGCSKASQAKTILQTLQDYGYGYWNKETGRLIFFQDNFSTSA